MSDTEKIKFQLEETVKSQGQLLNAQTILISQLMIERDEAIRNKQIASAQWEQWRKMNFI